MLLPKQMHLSTHCQYDLIRYGACLGKYLSKFKDARVERRQVAFAPKWRCQISRCSLSLPVSLRQMLKLQACVKYSEEDYSAAKVTTSVLTHAHIHHCHLEITCSPVQAPVVS